jgi:hypothetical protein
MSYVSWRYPQAIQKDQTTAQKTRHKSSASALNEVIHDGWAQYDMQPILGQVPVCRIPPTTLFIETTAVLRHMLTLIG